MPQREQGGERETQGASERRRRESKEGERDRTERLADILHSEAAAGGGGKG